jgi:hypothetical protein
MKLQAPILRQSGSKVKAALHRNNESVEKLVEVFNIRKSNMVISSSFPFLI